MLLELHVQCLVSRFILCQDVTQPYRIGSKAEGKLESKTGNAF